MLVAFVYDSTQKDVIQKGVEVAGVKVGGLTADQAKRKLRRELSPRLDRPVRVVAGGERFRLSPEQASLKVDVNGMVDEAVAVTRSKALPLRVFDSLTEARSTAELEARVDYSRSAVRRFARDVKNKVDRQPLDASVSFEAGSSAELPVRSSSNGLTINRAKLRSALEAALDKTVGRSVRTPVKVTKPEVTSAELAPKYPVVVTVDRANFELRLFKDLKLTKTYPIAVGQAGLDTPAGLYNIQNKSVDPSWFVPNKEWAGDLAGKVIPSGSPDNPLKARWLGVYDGVGVHGTAEEGSLGTAVSHGCIRMTVKDVKELYRQVPVGASIYIS